MNAFILSCTRYDNSSCGGLFLSCTVAKPASWRGAWGGGGGVQVCRAFTALTWGWLKQGKLIAI